MAVLHPDHMMDLVEGRFGRTTHDDLVAALRAASGVDHLCVHVHGGLVTREGALAQVEELQSSIAPHAWPLFVLWNSGLLRTFGQNLDEIGADLLPFRLIAHAREVIAGGSTRGPQMSIGEPEERLAEILARDPVLERAFVRTRSDVGSGPSHVSATVATELSGSADGLWRTLARHVLGVVRDVATRQRTEPDRPLGATVAEEVLRRFYGDAIGGALWSAMKVDTGEAFGADDGGGALIEELGRWWTPGRRITFVGHSAGSVFFCHMLAHMAALPEGCTLDVVLLAPACSFSLLHETLQAHGDRIRQLRIFGLSDGRERGYSEVPLLYPASLLYLVSGLCEAEPDTPIVGMQRYWDREAYPADRFPDVAGVRQWVAGHGARTVWAPADDAPGAICHADTHGGVGHEAATLGSVTWLLGHADWPARERGGSGSEPCDVVAQWIGASHSHPIRRQVPEQVGGGHGFRAAVAQVDLTRELYQSTAGYGLPKAHRAQGWHGRLRAVLVLVEDHRGQRVLIVAADLLAGTRYLSEALGAHLADIGLSVDRVLFFSSHTHSGPGRSFGVPLYDRVAGSSLFGGFDVRGTERLVACLVRAARSLPAELAAARIGTGTADAWGVFWNRSLEAHLANFFEPRAPSPQAIRRRLEEEALRWHPGTVIPEGLPDGRLAVDARLQVLHVGPDRDEAVPWAVIGFAGATPTLSAYHVGWYSADAFGAAARELERRLRREHGVHVPVGVVGSANGDVNVVLPDWTLEALQRCRDAHTTRGPDTGRPRTDRDRRAVSLHLARLAGIALADPLGVALAKARSTAVRPDRIDVRFSQSIIPEGTGPLEDVDAPAHLGTPSTDRYTLPCRWRVGQSTTAASELNRPWATAPPPAHALERSERIAAPQPLLQRVDWADPHSPREPKVRMMGLPAVKQAWFGLLGPLGALGLDPFLPLRVVSLGDVHLITVPVEPSVQFTRELRQALSPVLAGDVLIGGISGGYTGYASTVGEYVVHDYEGASSYWGRHFGTYLRQQCAELATHPPLAVGHGAVGQAWFVRNKAPIEDIPHELHEDAAERGFVPPRLERFTDPLEDVRRDDTVVRLIGDWRPKRRPTGQSPFGIGHPQPAGSWFVRLIRDGEPLILDGTPVDDVHHEFGVWFDRDERRWFFLVELPIDRVAGQEVSFEIRDDDRVAPRGGFVPPAPVRL